jgi:Zn-dependent peptidase ImmA (M78 family)
MVNGVVGNNNRRKLNPDEFRGFALADDLAPLVFINGADSKAAQMFTLAHELAHIWIGASALSDVGPASSPSMDIERWCSQVAAEVLVPAAVFLKELRRDVPIGEEVSRLALLFKVNTLVVLRRVHDVGGLARDYSAVAYRDELARISAFDKRSGGDLYLTQAAQVSKRFARALVVSTLEQQTLYTDAFRLLGVSKLATFRELGHSLGVA